MMNSHTSYCNENAVPRDPNALRNLDPSHVNSLKQEETRSESSTPLSMNFEVRGGNWHRRADMSTVSLSPIEEGDGNISPIRMSTLLDMPMGEIDIPSTEELEDSNYEGISLSIVNQHNSSMYSEQPQGVLSIHSDNSKSARSRRNSNVSDGSSISSKLTTGGDATEASPSSVPHHSVHPQHYPPHNYMPPYGAPPHAAYAPPPYGHYLPHVPPYYPPPPPAALGQAVPAPPVVPPTPVTGKVSKTSNSASPPNSTQAPASTASDPTSSTPAATKVRPTVTPAAPSHAPPAGYPHPSAWPYPGAPPPPYPHAAMYPPPPGYPHPMLHPMYHPAAYYNYPHPLAPTSAPAATKEMDRKSKTQGKSIKVKEEANESVKTKKKETHNAHFTTEVPSSTAVVPPPHLSMPPTYHLFHHPPHPHPLHPHPHFPPHMHGLPPPGPYTACQRTLELARRKEKAKKSKRSKKSKKDRPRKSSKSSRLHSKAIFRSKNVTKNETAQDHSTRPNGTTLQLSVRPSYSSNVSVPVPTQTLSEEGTKAKAKVTTCRRDEKSNTVKPEWELTMDDKDTKTEDGSDFGTSCSVKGGSGASSSGGIVERRARKNSQSRQRAARLKDRIVIISSKDPSTRTQEEAATLELYEQRRERKNGRSRERAIERKRKMDVIMAKPESEWTNKEKDFIDDTMIAKYKKNEGDRLRRKKLKDMRVSSGDGCSLEEGPVKMARSSSRSRRGNNGDGIPSQISNVTSQDDCTSEPNQDLSGITLDNDDGELDLVQAFRGSIENMWNDDINHDRLSPTFMLFKDGDINEEQMDAPFLTPVSKKALGVDGSSSSMIFGSSKGHTSSGQQNFVLPTPPASHRQIDSMLNGGMLSTSTILSGLDDTSDTSEWPAHLMVPFSNGSNDLKGAHQLSSPIRTSPLNLPRRSTHRLSHSQTSEGRTLSMSKDHYNTQFREGSYVGHSTEPIAVSFSVDTA